MCRGENGANPPHGISISSTFFIFVTLNMSPFLQKRAKRIEGEVVMSSTPTYPVKYKISATHYSRVEQSNLLKTITLVVQIRRKTHKTIFPTFRFD